MKSLDRKRTSGRNGFRNRMDWKKNMRKKNNIFYNSTLICLSVCLFAFKYERYDERFHDKIALTK